jgi:hypothetical protein
MAHTDEDVWHGSLTIPTREVILDCVSIFDQVEPTEAGVLGNA